MKKKAIILDSNMFLARTFTLLLKGAWEIMDFDKEEKKWESNSVEGCVEIRRRGERS